jgi:hypothetical protein
MLDKISPTYSFSLKTDSEPNPEFEEKHKTFTATYLISHKLGITEF